ncbi:MAG: ATP-binding protein [Micropruina sp.]
MITTTWVEVDRRIGLGVTLCGLCVLLLNSLVLSAQVVWFDTWWVALAAVVPALQLLTAIAWSRLAPGVLRAIWMAQPAILFVALVLSYAAWYGAIPEPTNVSIWLLDAPVLALLALTLRLPYVLAATALLAAAPPLSSLLFLGTIAPSLLATGFAHASNVIYVMLALVLRHQLDRLSRAQEVATRLQIEQQNARTRSADFADFARTVHDEVLAAFAAALHFEAEPPEVVRRSAAVGLQALARRRQLPDLSVEAVELCADDAEQLILDLLAAAAPDVQLHSAAGTGTVPSVTAGALGLAAAEAARNAVRHAGGGAATVWVDDGTVRVTIADSGGGFEPEHVPAGRFGVRESIVRRVEELDGGRVAFETGAGGTTVVLEWMRPRG